MLKRSARSSGQQAEDLAAQHLQTAGLKLLARNYYCRYGEIDLVCQDARHAMPSLVFVEVRYRRSAQFGGALESITPSKQQKIHLAASHFMQNQPAQTAARFDVVAISGDLQQPRIDWLEDVDITV